MFQSKRDILSETKYIELVLVADHQEVSESTTANANKNDLLTNINNFFIYIFSNGSQPHQGVASLVTHNVKMELKKSFQRMKEQYWVGSWWLVSIYVCFMLATSPSSFLSGVFLAQREGLEMPHRAVQLQA